MTGLRGWAALAVFLSHLQLLGFFSVNDASLLTARFLGKAGVSLFFVLSGFVLALNYPPGRCTAREFFRGRFARIYPVYLLGVLLAVPAEWLGHAHQNPWHAFFASIFLVQQYLPSTNMRFNQVGWTLSVEALFYILYPLLSLWLVRKSPARAWVVAGIAYAVNAGITYYADYSFYLGQNFPPNRLGEFLIGIAAAQTFQTGCWRESVALHPKRWFAVTAAAGVLLYTIPCWLGFPLTIERLSLVFTSPLSVVVILGVAELERGGHTWRGLCGPTAIFMGEISYAFYLLHQILLRNLDGVLRVTGLPRLQNLSLSNQIMIAAADLVVSIIAARIVYLWIEEPMRKRLRTPAPVRSS